MNKQQAKKRIKKLKETIKRHRYLYHVKDKQEISPEALDSLKKELAKLEREFPDLITQDSPTQRVGGEPLDEFEEYTHFTPMLSFRDGFSQEEIKNWVDRMERHLDREEDFNFFCEYKIDGLAVELVYRDDLLDVASTRGNGEVGENVTKNIKTIESIPLRLRSEHDFSSEEKRLSDSPDWTDPKDLIIRGEIFISRQKFSEINKKRKQEGEDAYSNPRNLAAGSVRQLDPKVAASRDLDFFAYELTANLQTGETIQPFGAQTHQKEHQLLETLGFKTTKEKCAQNLKEVFQFHRKAKEKREELDYEIDGVAIIVNDNTLFDELGVTGKAPRGRIAYKFPLKQATTEVKDIKVQIGRTGIATPVAILEPVELGGVTVSRATLHNPDEIQRLDIRVGDTVVVGRAGDVIPYVVETLPEMRTGEEESFEFPDACPVCGQDLVRPEGEVDKRCINKDCPARQKEQLKHFVSKSSFDIEGLGGKILDQLIENGLVTDPADIFQLKEEDLIPLERFAEKSAENIIKAIADSKEISLARFIYALGISQVGEQTAQDLTTHFKSLEELQQASKEELSDVADIGPVVAKEIKEWFEQEENINLIKRLKQSGVQIEKKAVSQQLEGTKFVFTGRLDSFTRDEAQKEVRELGARTGSSVTNDTDYLVKGESPGSKLQKAEDKGIEVLTEREFKNLL